MINRPPYDEAVNESIPGWMTHDELQWLYRQAARMGSIVEIGSWMGRSTYALCSGCPGVVYAVDHFKGSPSEVGRGLPHEAALTRDIHATFLSHVGHFPNLRVCRMDSVEAALTATPQSVDMVFIDGEHTFEAVSRDFAAWRPKCRALFCGHDRAALGVKRAREAFALRDHDGPGSLWYEELQT